MPKQKKMNLSPKKLNKLTNKSSLKKNNKKDKKKSLKGGLMEKQISNYGDNMMNRKFNCRQPFWEASCI